MFTQTRHFFGKVTALTQTRHFCESDGSVSESDHRSLFERCGCKPVLGPGPFTEIAFARGNLGNPFP